MITKILDNYFSEKFKRRIKNCLFIYNLDIKFEDNKNEVRLLAKPRKHKEYTYIYSWEKESSLNEYLYFDQEHFTFDEEGKIKFLFPSMAKELRKTINRLDEERSWN